MIARIWEGEVSLEDGESYFEVLKRTGIPDYMETDGNRGVFVLERDEGETTHFLLITMWDSMEAIKSFAGQPVEEARYYPEDEGFLIEMRPTVDHYRVRLIHWPDEQPPADVLAGRNDD